MKAMRQGSGNGLPAMPGCVLHAAIALAQMDLLSIVQFQRHLATNHDPIIDGI
jgi:hypothetical protein